MVHFEIGKVYNCKSICDTNCVWSYKVVGRTKATITLEDIDTNKVKTYRVSKSVSEFYGAEAVYPLGRYSMCPVLNANK